MRYGGQAVALTRSLRVNPILFELFFISSLLLSLQQFGDEEKVREQKEMMFCGREGGVTSGP